MLKMTINSNATVQLQNIVNKLDTFPNRIASAQQSALTRSQKQLIDQMSKLGKGAKYLKYNIKQKGPLGMSLEVGFPSRSNASEYYAALIFLKGRRGGKIIRAKSGRIMKLREESVRKGYPEYLRVVKLGPVRGKQDQFKQASRDIVLKNLKFAVQRFGFGPRGGSAGLADLPNVRSRAQ